jgi:hypothetical protein
VYFQARDLEDNMNCRRWCFGVTVVVVAIGMGGRPAAAQQPLPAVEVPKVEVPGVTVPSVTVPVPPGGPKIATPPVSTPPISTPPVHTPALVTPVGTVPSVSVPPVAVGSVTVSAVRTVPASTGAKPPAGGGESPKASEPPPSAGASAAQPEPRATPALAVRGTSTRQREGAAAVRPSATGTTAGGAERRGESRPTRRRQAAPTAQPARAPAGRATTPAVRVRDDREARAPIPVADTIERHQADARPLIDALGRALDLAPLLMALALGGALCVVSRQMRRVD